MSEGLPACREGGRGGPCVLLKGSVVAMQQFANKVRRSCNDTLNFDIICTFDNEWSYVIKMSHTSQVGFSALIASGLFWAGHAACMRFRCHCASRARGGCAWPCLVRKNIAGVTRCQSKYDDLSLMKQSYYSHVFMCASHTLQRSLMSMSCFIPSKTSI